MVFNATFNNISVISWRSVLLVEEIGVPGESYRLRNIKDLLSQIVNNNVQLQTFYEFLKYGIYISDNIIDTIRRTTYILTSSQDGLVRMCGTRKCVNDIYGFWIKWSFAD